MTRRSVLLIEGRSSKARFRAVLAEAGCDLTVIPADGGRFRLTLMALPDFIVLDAVESAEAKELIRKIRSVGFEMPAMMVTPRGAAGGEPGNRYTIDVGSPQSTSEVEWLTHLARHPVVTATEAADELHGDVVDAPSEELPLEGMPPRGATNSNAPGALESRGAPIGAPRESPAGWPAGARAGRRRSGAAPLGRRFQSCDTTAESRSTPAAPISTPPTR